MKAVKRNAVVLTVMLFICAAVYLNWSYNKKVEDAAKVDGADKTEDTTGDTAAGSQSTGDVPAGDDAGLYYSVTGGDTSGASTGTGDTSDTTGSPSAVTDGKYDEYFAQVRLERSQARDEAAATLSAVASAEGASQETIDGALKAMTDMAGYSVKEAELENLIRAKGFIDCVVYLTDDSASVTAAKEGGLDKAAVAQITDIIVTGTGLTAADLTVTEIK